MNIDEDTLLLLLAVCRSGLPEVFRKKGDCLRIPFLIEHLLWLLLCLYFSSRYLIFHSQLSFKKRKKCKRWVKEWFHHRETLGAHNTVVLGLQL